MVDEASNDKVAATVWPQALDAGCDSSGDARRGLAARQGATISRMRRQAPGLGACDKVRRTWATCDRHATSLQPGIVDRRVCDRDTASCPRTAAATARRLSG